MSMEIRNYNLIQGVGMKKYIDTVRPTPLTHNLVFGPFYLLIKVG